METDPNSADERIDLDRLRGMLVKRLIRKEEIDDLRRQLTSRLGHEKGNKLLNQAVKEYENLKTSVNWKEVEYNAFFKERKITRHGKRKIIVGAIFIVLSIIATVESYINALPGGTYSIAIGAFAFGLYLIIRGGHEIH
jgi:hypothetical protein